MKNWQQLVLSAPVRSYRRNAKIKAKLLARYVPKVAFDKHRLPTFLYTSGNLNRCNPKGVSCIYFGEGAEAARAEFDSYYDEPLAEVGYYARASLRSIIDFEDSATRKHFGVSSHDFTRSYVTKSGELIPLQEIGKAVAAQYRIAAIRFPSNAMKRKRTVGYNLVVFQNLLKAPDYLEILEGAVVVERWPGVP